MKCEHNKQVVMIELGLGVTRCEDCDAVLRVGRIVGWFKEGEIPGYFMFKQATPVIWNIPERRRR